jgi:hypothetical protein
MDRASLWNGTAESWVDLSAFLPAGYSQSYAHDIWSDGAFIYVAGEGRVGNLRRWEALLWTSPVAEPGAATVVTCFGAIAARAARGRKKIA